MDPKHVVRISLLESNLNHGPDVHATNLKLVSGLYVRWQIDTPSPYPR